MHWNPNVVILQRLPDECTECGVRCQKCARNYSVKMEKELEESKLKLVDSINRMIKMEDDFKAVCKVAEMENVRLKEELHKLNESNGRLLENYNGLLKVNHSLETKLLSLVEKYELDQKRLYQRIYSVTSDLLDAKGVICDMEDDLERCRSDCNIAVQLLQCRPSQFVEHKLSSLPKELQQRVQHGVRNVEQPARKSATAAQSPVTYSRSSSSSSVADSTKVLRAAVAHVLTKPAVKPRPGRLVICGQCQTSVTVVDREQQTDSDAVQSNPSSCNGVNRHGLDVHGEG